MSLTTLAMVLALAGPQDPPSHAQTISCTGVFLMASVIAASAAEEDPTPENQEFVAAAGRLMKAADDDRLAAARREGLSNDASQQAMSAWIDANVDDSQGVIERELEPCLIRYQHVL